MREIKVDLIGPLVLISPSQQQFAIGLNEQGEKRGCQISISHFQATCIDLTKQKKPLPWIISIHPLKNLLAKLDIKLERAVVTRLEESTFQAVIHLNHKGTKITLDILPTDAIILALLLNKDIFINEELLSNNPSEFTRTSEISQLAAPNSIDNIRKWFDELNPDEITNKDKKRIM